MPTIHRRISAVAGVAVMAALATTAGTGIGTASAAPHPAPRQSVEYFTEPGGHPHHRTVLAAPTPPRQLVRPGGKALKGDGAVTSIVDNGPIGSKLDVVFIGDGYTAGQQQAFHDAVRTKWAKMSAVEPYASYKNLFNVWAVDAVSQDSGVSGDPAQGVVKNTALNSAFFCDGVERLLCVDTGKVETYAAKAPAADLVVVLANSTKYGGAGYNDVKSQVGYDGIATASSNNDKSDQVAVHETGHSLGKLADEYQYDGYGTYGGAEPWETNITKSATGAKWSRWAGQTSPDGGTVGAYEGGGYYPKGIYRPTENSIMRSLGREFNLPGREAMIAGFYRHASVIAPADGTTGNGDHVGRNARIAVREGAPATTSLYWYVDGHEVSWARNRTAVTPRTLGVPADGGTHWVTAWALDQNTAVRDPAVAKTMRTALRWQVSGN
ncbi:M64 family metallopeptidase [Streptomyces sp. NPDC049585]|uniref:M64 family metallopeptidase n=1 Tax=Streptomyces sp. NPDC049585 TaxID=3155154 RepID=UPI0034353462